MGDKMEETKRSTTAYYPRYQSAPQDRMLAYLAGHTIHTEAGGVIQLEPYNWERLSSAIYLHNMQLWCDDISRNLRPMLPAIFAESFIPAEERKGRQWCECHLDPDEGMALVGISIHRGKWVRHINCASRWQDGTLWQIEMSSEEDNAAWLAKVRWLGDTLRVGIKGTPGGMGESALRNAWPRDEHTGRIAVVSRPDLRCVQAIEQWSIGSRMELFAEPGIIHDVVYRMDMSGAYPAFAGELPGGRMVHIGEALKQTETLLKPYDDSPPLLPTSTWFAQCLVQIDEPGIPAGDVLPFAVKRRAKGTRQWEIVWPTAPGFYGHKEDEQCWLWREVVDELERLRREEGYPVHVVWMGEAFAWTEWTYQLRPWARVMEEARRTAPDKPHEKLVKLATNAGFGRLGMGYHSRHIIPAEQATPEDELLVTQASGPDMDRFYIRTEREDPGTPIHWHRYVLMRCSLEMSKAMHHNFLRGVRNMAVYVDEIEVDRYPGAEYNEPAWRMGGWKLKELHGWVGYAPGHIHAIEDQRMPGIESWRKEQLYRWGERRETRRKHLNEEAGAVRAAPMSMERWREIQEKRIAPWYAERQEEARRAQLRALEQLAAQMERDRERAMRPKWADQR